jgi:hypothetical protein
VIGGLASATSVAVPGAWTTTADWAELDCAVMELMYVAFEHRETCEECASTRYVCTRIEKATDALIAWWERRCLLSRAQFYGALQDRREAA